MDYHVKIGRQFLKEHLGIVAYHYQDPIINATLDWDIQLNTIRAATRSGKSFIISGCLIACASIYENIRIGIIAPSKDKTKIIMTYILELLSSSDLETIIDLDTMGLSRIERLKKEVSKSRVTFKNGSSIEIKTADVKNKGFSLMGSAYDIVVIDESAELTQDVWTKIARMLLENPKTKIVELYNPWFLNHCYDHSQDPKWNVIKIDYKDCLREGRFTQEQIDMVLEEITNPIDRRVLIDAEFPDTPDNSLFSYEKILKARRIINEPKEAPNKILAVDVARMGMDDTIVYLLHQYGGMYMVKQMWKLDKQRLTRSAGDIIKLIEELEVNQVKIDGTGIGSGLEDNLSEYIDNTKSKVELISIVFSNKADDIHNLNRKADIFFNLAYLIEKESLIIPDDDILIRQLRNLQYEVQSSGKKKIVDNQSKSPDRADALAIGCYTPKKDNFCFKW